MTILIDSTPFLSFSGSVVYCLLKQTISTSHFNRSVSALTDVKVVYSLAYINDVRLMMK